MSKTAVRITLALSALFTILIIGLVSAQESSLVVVESVVWGREGIHDESLTCTKTSRFFLGEQVVWRVKVIDGLTGAEMGDEELQSVMVTMLDGQEFEMDYGPHPRNEPVDFFWTANWVIPEDYPSGIVDYGIDAVANDGRTGSLVEFPIESSVLTVLPN